MLRKNQVNWSEKLENFKQSLSSSSSNQFLLAIILAISHILPLQCTYTVSIGYVIHMSLLLSK